MKYLEKIQGLLPLGYLYLIVLGLLKESILYYQLGINILKYSSITDIFISPLSDLTSSPLLAIIVFSVLILFFIAQNFVVHNSHKNWAQKILGRERFGADATKKEVRKKLLPFFILFAAFELLSLFVGLGIGEGSKLSKRISHNEFVCNYKITFSSGGSEEIFVIDLNSSYYFYVTKGDKNIKIAPVGTINHLEVINNKKLQ